jgi:hypothetical protein
LKEYIPDGQSTHDEAPENYETSFTGGKQPFILVESNFNNFKIDRNRQFENIASTKQSYFSFASPDLFEYVPGLQELQLLEFPE